MRRNFFGLGPKVVGTMREDDSNGPESSISISRALEKSSIGKDIEENKDEDLLEGMSRVPLSQEALEVVERATFTNKALCAETSRYIDSPSFFKGDWDLSSSTPSGFNQVMENGGSLGGLAFVDGGKE